MTQDSRNCVSVLLFLSSGKCVVAFMFTASLDTVFPSWLCVLGLFKVMRARCSNIFRGTCQSFVYTNTYHSAFGASSLPTHFQDETTSDSIIFQLLNKADLKFSEKCFSPPSAATLHKDYGSSWRLRVLNSFLSDVLTLAFSRVHPTFLVTFLCPH